MLLSVCRCVLCGLHMQPTPALLAWTTRTSSVGACTPASLCARRYADVVVHRLLAAAIGIAPLPEALRDSDALHDCAGGRWLGGCRGRRTVCALGSWRARAACGALRPSTDTWAPCAPVCALACPPACLPAFRFLS